MSNLKLKSTKVEKKVTDTYKAIENHQDDVDIYYGDAMERNTTKRRR